MLHEIFENSFEVVVSPNHGSPTVALQLWVKVGSLDELPHQRGMAHFLEHMLFKGTNRRGVGEIAAAVEMCGGEINAYTTFDHTVYHLTLAAPHVQLGIDILADSFANSSLLQEEFELEKEVIIEEISRSLDSPSGKVGKRIFELAFAGTEAGRPIIGTKESVGSFKHDDLREFYETWYVPSNAFLVVAGDVDSEAIMVQIRNTFGSLTSQQLRSSGESKIKSQFAFGRRTTKNTKPIVSILKGEFEQPRLEITFPAPPLTDLDSAALDVAAFALGSGEMSRLNRRLRDREGAVTSIGATVYSPLFGGLFEISALLSESQMLQGIRGISREMMQIQTFEPISDEELDRACANLKAERVFRDETVDGQARSLGFGMLTPFKFLQDETYASVVSSIPATLVTGALKRWVRPEHAIIVVLVPDRSSLTEDQIRLAFEQGLADVQKPLSQPVLKNINRNKILEKLSVDVIEIKPGLKFIYRQNIQGQIFSLTAATEGGLRAETSQNCGHFNAIGGLLGLASTHSDYNFLHRFVEGHGAILSGFSGKDSIGYHLQCLPEDTLQLLRLWGECLLDPVFPEEQWQTLKREIEQGIISQADSAASICMRRFQENIFAQHPYRFPLIGTENSVSSFSCQSLLQSYLGFQQAGPWVIAATGPETVDVVLAALREGLENFSPSPLRRLFESDQLVSPVIPASINVAMEREQTHIVYGYKGLSWDDPDRAALDVLVNILGGHGGRLFKSLRDKEALAYAVSPIISYGCHPGAVGSYIACSPSKKPRALEKLKKEMLDMKRSPPSSQELQRAQNHIVGMHDMGLQRSDSLTSSMALMELYGCNFNDFETYPQSILAVTEEDILRVAQRLFLTELSVDVSVGQE